MEVKRKKELEKRERIILNKEKSNINILLQKLTNLLHITSTQATRVNLTRHKHTILPLPNYQHMMAQQKGDHV